MNTFYTGDVLEILSSLPSESVNCCVTSPPYFGLRDYGVIGQIGVEQTPDEYVSKIVNAFRGVRRVLRKDGTLWLNLGDSYASSGGKTQPHRDSCGGIGKKGTRGEQPYHAAGGGFIRPDTTTNGLKVKDLIGIPWRVAFALQADGWYLRSDIIWNKPNAMPESVRDRPTKAHEYIFLLSKSRKYYYDSDVIKEPAKEWKGQAATFERDHGKAILLEIPGQKYSSHRSGRKQRESVKRGGFNGKTNALLGREAFRAIVPTRNKRSVWTVATKPFKGAHFAVFPPDLIKPCILAGCPIGGKVLDPFGGSGTVAMVASELGRDSIYIDLNSEYTEMAKERATPIINYVNVDEELNDISLALEGMHEAWDDKSLPWDYAGVKKAPLPEESPKKNSHLDCTIDLVRVESFLDPRYLEQILRDGGGLDE
jgi:DNA modification methylase